MTKNLFIFSIFMFLACTANPADMNMHEEEEHTEHSSTYLALGDSYTIGQSVEEKDRFPVLLVKTLNERGYDFDAPRIVARTGWTTDELASGIEAADIRDTFSLVTLLIGVNNQYRGRSVAEFRVQFAGLLELAIAFAGDEPSKVIVVSIPDWGVSPFAAGLDKEKIAAEIDLFNSAKKEITLSRQVRFVDITDISRLALDTPEYIASDGLHFSGAMHQLWVDEIVSQCFNP